MISLRVLRNALQRVNAAQPDSQRLMTNLFNGLGVAIGDLALLSEPMYPAIEPKRQQSTQPDEAGQQRRAGISDRLEPSISAPTRMTVELTAPATTPG
jgi:hypothetical protein